MDEPIYPDALTPARIRDRRAAHRALVTQAGLHGPLHDGPAGCAFLEHEIVRVSVTQTDAAKAYLLQSNQQGRLFPLALSEVFGAIAPDVSIHLDVMPRAERQDIEGDDGHIITITVLKDGKQHHAFHQNAVHLVTIHPQTRMPVFNALNVARELGRLYQHLYLKEQE